MTASGVAKLIEECGELTQILGKKLAYWHTDEHPDGKGSINERIEDEMGDVIAAVYFAIQGLGLNFDRIDARWFAKIDQFREWHKTIDNNHSGIDRLSVIDGQSRCPECRGVFLDDGSGTHTDACTAQARQRSARYERDRAAEHRRQAVHDGTPFCTANTTAGSPCRSSPIAGSTYCNSHASDDIKWAREHGLALGHLGLAIAEDLYPPGSLQDVVRLAHISGLRQGFDSVRGATA